MTNNEFIARLREACRAFDAHHGGYPEHEFEGWTVFEFIRGLVTGQPSEDTVPEDWPMSTSPPVQR